MVEKQDSIDRLGFFNLFFLINLLAKWVERRVDNIVGRHWKMLQIGEGNNVLMNVGKWT